MKITLKGTLITLLFFAIFAGFGTFLLYRTYSNQQSTKNFITTIGVVVDYREKYEPNEGEPYYDPYFDEDYVFAPIVEYVVNGKTYTAYSSQYKRTPLHVGSPIEVSYNPNDPSKAIIEGTVNRIQDYFIGVLCIAIVPLVVIGGFVINKSKSKKN